MLWALVTLGFTPSVSWITAAVTRAEQTLSGFKVCNVCVSWDDGAKGTAQSRRGARCVPQGGCVLSRGSACVLAIGAQGAQASLFTTSHRTVR